MEEIDIGFEELEEESFDEYEDYDGYDEYADYLFNNKDEEEFNKPSRSRDVENVDTLEKHQEYIRDQKILEDMKEELDEKAKEMYPLEKNYHSLVMEYFTPEICIELERIVRTFSIDNNDKFIEIKKILKRHNIPFDSLGNGTNRGAVMIDGYAVKIAFDIDGMVDNKREFIYSLALQPYVVKTYECSPTGLISVCEYVVGFTEEAFTRRVVQEQMRRILKDIAESFFIGDVGITAKNYLNWGTRIDTDEIVILDYAYVYSVSYNTFQCSKDGGTLYYDRDFIKLICPICGKEYTFGQLRKRISRDAQDTEIGNIEQKGYLMSKSFQKKRFNHRFVLDATDKIRKQIEKDKRKEEKKKQWQSDKPNNYDYDVAPTMSNIINKYKDESAK